MTYLDLMTALEAGATKGEWQTDGLTIWLSAGQNTRIGVQNAKAIVTLHNLQPHVAAVVRAAKAFVDRHGYDPHWTISDNVEDIRAALTALDAAAEREGA